MNSRVFIDTNILIYADDGDAGPKQKRARTVIRELVRSGTAVLSTQVLNEYFVIATKKLGSVAQHVRATGNPNQLGFRRGQSVEYFVGNSRPESWLGSPSN
ncbi:MAG: hypothetical protein HY791_06355 [Deltaproteobacteria bacterium]|nr:hypothetical protein [Deltaproteobacteria bacterium]